MQLCYFETFLAKDRKQAAANMPVVVLSLNLRFDRRVGREASKGFYYHHTPAVDHFYTFSSSTALHASQTNMIAAHTCTFELPNLLLCKQMHF